MAAAEVRCTAEDCACEACVHLGRVVAVRGEWYWEQLLAMAKAERAMREMGMRMPGRGGFR